MKLNFDVVIIGAGVAGMTAAIYLKRAGINCCIIEKNIYGGQINLSPKVKNYPGFMEISGVELSTNIYNQMRQLNVEYLNESVINIEIDKIEKQVTTTNKVIICKYIIIATGRHARKLNIENAKQLIGKGISYCATCDGNFYKGKDVAVIGGGNKALEEAIYLSEICRNVIVINEGNKLIGNRYYKEKIQSIKNINIKYNSNIKALNLKDDKLDSIVIEKQGIVEQIFVEGCFTYIGYEPTTEFFDNVELDDEGYIIVDKNNKTNIDNIYAIGDVVNKPIFQLITAMNDSVIAANEIINKINVD